MHKHRVYSTKQAHILGQRLVDVGLMRPRDWDWDWEQGDRGEITGIDFSVTDPKNIPLLILLDSQDA